jgi:hypothetical protein
MKVIAEMRCCATSWKIVGLIPMRSWNFFNVFFFMAFILFTDKLIHGLGILAFKQPEQISTSMLIT